METKYVRNSFQEEVTQYAHLWGLEKQEAFEELREEAKDSNVGRRC